MNDLLTLPIFARIDEYAGLWLMPADHFAAMVERAKLLDARHFEQKTEPLAVVEKVAAAGGKTISVVRLNGLLMKGRSSVGGTSTIEARREIRNAANDPDVAGIMLAVDSPGGTVAGTFELAEEIRAARRKKPVYAHIDDLGASAAYWAASQAEHISANAPTALIGSIGTLQTVYDESASFEQQGVKTLLFATGPLKGLGTPGTKVTDDQAAHVQALVDSVQQSFDSAVKKGRGMSVAELTAVSHGGVLTAQAAIDAKLIDSIQPLTKSIDDLSRSLSQNGGRQRAELVARAFPMIAHGGLPSLLVPGDAQC